MMAITHAVFSIFIAKIFAPDIYIMLLSAIFSALPDIDTLKSGIGKRFPLIALVFRHRGVFHSAFIYLFFASILYFLNMPLFIGFSIGFLSHLLLDALTPSGIWPFYPFGFRIRGFVRTNSAQEWIFCGFIILIFFLSCY